MAIALQKIADSANNTKPTFAAPLTSDTAPWGSVLYVKNGAATPVTVTITAAASLETGDSYPAHAVTVPATDERCIPLKFGAYLNPTSQNVAVAFSSVTSVTVAAIAIA